MKAVSDVKLNKAIRRIQGQFDKVDTAASTYEIETEEDFQAAMIEQASSMAPGSERLVYFYDTVPSVFSHGYGVAKLYHHESYEQGGSAFVAVDIFDAGRRFCMNVVKSDTDGNWSCTERVRLVTSKEASDTYLTKDEAVNTYYTMDEVDEMFAGITREFQVDNPGSVYQHDNTKSKFYIVTFADTASHPDTVMYTTVTIDYRGIPVREDGKSTSFRFPYTFADGTEATIRLLIWKNPDTSIRFQVSPETPSTLTIATICGYY